MSLTLCTDLSKRPLLKACYQPQNKRWKITHKTDLKLLFQCYDDITQYYAECRKRERGERGGSDAEIDVSPDSLQWLLEQYVTDVGNACINSSAPNSGVFGPATKANKPVLIAEIESDVLGYYYLLSVRPKEKLFPYTSMTDLSKHAQVQFWSVIDKKLRSLTAVLDDVVVEIPLAVASAPLPDKEVLPESVDVPCEVTPVIAPVPAPVVTSILEPELVVNQEALEAAVLETSVLEVHDESDGGDEVPHVSTDTEEVPTLTTFVKPQPEALHTGNTHKGGRRRKK